jgi:hypothetical protein
MIAIRLPKAQRGKAWRAMIEIAPIRLITKDPIYEVTPAHIEMLTARCFKFEVVQLPMNGKDKRRHATAD